MQQTSRVTIEVDGDPFRTKFGSSTIQPGGISRENNEMTDQNEFVYREQDMPAIIRTTVIHVADTDITKFRGMKDVTVTYKPDVGKVYTVANAVCTQCAELGNGEVQVTFMGSPATS